jgi:hypothetical protein
MPGTRPLTADRPPAEVAVWNHPIRVTTVPPGRVQGEYHGETLAVKVENVADDGIQWEVEGGDHRLLLRLDHGGQSPPVDPAAQDRGRRRDLPGRVVQHLRPSPQGLHTGRGGGGPDIRGPPARQRGGQQAPRPATARTSLPCSCPSPSRRRSPPCRATKAGWGAARPRLASRTGHRRMRGQPGANQTWRAASTVSTPQVQQGSDDRWASIGRPLHR